MSSEDVKMYWIHRIKESKIVGAFLSMIEKSVLIFQVENKTLKKKKKVYHWKPKEIKIQLENLVRMDDSIDNIRNNKRKPILKGLSQLKLKIWQ